MTKLDSALFVIRASSLIRHSTFVLRHLPKTLRQSRRLRGNRDGAFSHPWSRRESPHPNTENGGDDKRDPAYAHWNGQGSNSDLGMLDQS
jgi:hypothetical protein